VKLLITLNLGFVCNYCWLSPSVLRSVVMFSFVAVRVSITKNCKYLSHIVSALLILPTYLFDVGFQLSYLALFLSFGFNQ
jgi:competence protein ComEC